MPRGGRFILAATGLVGGCAGPSLLLLPGEQGDQGAVAVLESGGKPQETVVSDVNSRTKLGRANPRTRVIGAARVKTSERALVARLPPPPVSFILYFEEGAARITSESRPQLDAIRAEVARRPGVDVQLTGHADTLGSSEDNDALAQARALQILDILAGEGIDRSVMTALGRGEGQLRVETADGVRDAANRRVEVVVR